MWRHNYLGTQGIIILVDENTDKDILENEINVITNDQNTSSVPILFVINKESIDTIMMFEKIRTNINKDKEKNSNANFQFINFKTELDLISLGFLWLSDVMKPISE